MLVNIDKVVAVNYVEWLHRIYLVDIVTEIGLDDDDDIWSCVVSIAFLCAFCCLICFIIGNRSNHPSCHFRFLIIICDLILLIRIGNVNGKKKENIKQDLKSIPKATNSCLKFYVELKYHYKLLSSINQFSKLP